MRRRTHNKLVADFANFAEPYVVGQGLSIHQPRLVKAIQTGKKVIVARPGRAGARLHMVDGQFVVSKPIQAWQSRYVIIDETIDFPEDANNTTDNAVEPLDTSIENTYNAGITN